MAGIRTTGVPRHIDGPSLVAAASALMLLPANASRHVRLHRLAAMGMAMGAHGAAAASPSAVRSILKRDDIGGPRILELEDPYSEALVQSISFSGGPYLVSGGSAEHAVADLENLIDAAFREGWMPDALRAPARQLIQGLLTVSDTVLRRVGLKGGTMPAGSPRTPIDVPGASRLKHLADAAFISNEELSAHGDWLRIVVDTFALDPGQLQDPCVEDYTDDRLHVTPFLRLESGYRVVLPLDLAITIRFHLLRFVQQEGQLRELAEHLREAALRRLMRHLPSDSSLVKLEQNDTLSRYLTRIDDKRDVHVIVATDSLVDWQAEVWGWSDTDQALQQIEQLISPGSRGSYSSAEELLHLVITDSPGRGAFWGVPNVTGSDPMLIARADDLEVILHQEPDGLLGLLLFAQAIENRPGRSMSTDILDEFSSYVDRQKSFYFSDDGPPTFTTFQTGDGLAARLKWSIETDRHGVVLPRPREPIVQVQRRYEHDAPEIFVTEPNGSYIGCVVELDDQAVFISLNPKGEFVGVELDLLDCVAYWVRECAILTGARVASDIAELVVTLSNPELWRRVRDWSTTDPAVRVLVTDSGRILEFTETFLSQLQERTNTAERELVAVLLTSVFGVASVDVTSTVETVAPIGAKRMLNQFSQNRSPDMLAVNLPRPLTGHDQVTAQLLDQLGEWLRSPAGGGFALGALVGQDRVRVLNAAVKHLFERLEKEIAVYDRRTLLDFLVAQNESLVHSARLNAMLLRSRLACFGEHSHTVAELVTEREEVATAHRANRFMIEYVAAQPPAGTRAVAVLDYYRLLCVAGEIIERGTISDFLHYDLADFRISILESGRLGVSRDEPVTVAMATYAENAGMRSVRDALGSDPEDGGGEFDTLEFLARSGEPMRAEFGFSLTELREVCTGLLDLAEEADLVTRIDRSFAIGEIATKQSLTQDIVGAVITGMTLNQRESFLGIGQDALPWRFNRDMSYVRRPLVLQGDELVFGFRSVYRLGGYLADNLLSGRLQGRARTTEMKRFISEARGKINDDFARSVATRLQRLGMTTRLSVKKIGKNRIVDSEGRDLGDIDVLAVNSETKTILAVEAKDFEIARTPAEIAHELEKLFSGKKDKKSTIELHGRRIDWLRQHLNQVIVSLNQVGNAEDWEVLGVVVTSDPLLTPLVRSSPIPVIPFEDLGFDSLSLAHGRQRRSSRNKSDRIP